MKKRIFILIAAVFVINISVGSIGYFTNRGSINVLKVKIGEDYPPSGVSTARQIEDSDKSSAVALLLLGIENYGATDYMASVQQGEVNGSKGNENQMKQILMSRRIRQDGRLYFDTSTMSDTKFSSGLFKAVNIKKLNEIFISDGTFYTRNGIKSSIKATDEGMPTAEQYGRRKSYPDANAFLQDNATDPRRISMHIFNEETLTETEAPVYDSASRTYKYKVSLDTEKGTLDYVRYVISMMDNMSDNVTFEEITFEVVQWDNGLIKEITVSEKYEIKDIIVIGSVRLSMTATTYFSYDDTEKGYQIDNFARHFGIN